MTQLKADLPDNRQPAVLDSVSVKWPGLRELTKFRLRVKEISKGYWDVLGLATAGSCRPGWGGLGRAAWC